MKDLCPTDPVTWRPPLQGRYNAAMSITTETFLNKARESLAGAESEFINGRYNNTANRSYYACFQAVVYALSVHGYAARPGRGRDTWSHDALQANFVGELINRRKLYSAELRDVLLRTQTLRNTADYEHHWVTETQAARALEHTRRLISAIERGATA
jgi:uncharacterized protein (UPF0332 family)